MEEKLKLLGLVQRANLNEEASLRILNAVLDKSKNQLSLTWVRAIAASMIVMFSCEILFLCMRADHVAPDQIQISTNNDFYE